MSILDSIHRVIVPAMPDRIWDRVDWCKANLPGEAMGRPILHGNDECELWYFDTPEEATMFALRWS